MEPINDRAQTPAGGLQPITPPTGSPPGGGAGRLPSPEGWLCFASGWLSLDQALGNLETAISLFQTAAEAMVGVGRLTGDVIGSLHAEWTRGDRGRPPPTQVDDLLRRTLEQIDGIVRACRFHGRGLIDGQSGVVGLGEGVDFVRGGPHATNSPPEGFEVQILAPPTRASLVGGVPIHEDWLRAEKEIFLAEGERFVRYSPQGVAGVSDFLVALQNHTRAAGLDLEVGLTRQRRLILRHNQYGSHHKFKGLSRLTPLLSKRPGKIEWSRKGRDIQGTLGGEAAFGVGRMLVGFLDNQRTSELAVMWRGADFSRGELRCHVRQNGLRFQDGAGPAREPRRISIPSFNTSWLGRWVEGRSEYGSLAEIRARTWTELADALQMLFAVSCEVDEWKERVQTWIQQHQSLALEFLRRELPPAVPAISPAAQRHALEQMAEAMRGLMIKAGGGRAH